MSILEQKHPFTLPALPFAKTDLEPYMTPETFSFHHEKHHNAYVLKLNELIENTDLSTKTLHEIIVATSEGKSQQAIFNNAAQVYNHDFFWCSMKKNGGGAPTGIMLEKINESFGSYDEFKTQFKNNGISQFGSGWVWLVQNMEDGKLSIIKTPNAETPLTNKSLKPILTADVWEHSYYIDFRNKRPDYLDTFLNNLINWDFALANLI